MRKTKTLLAAVIALAVSAGSLAAAPANSKESLDAQTLDTIRSDFRKLMELANRHDFQALHEMFWQSPSTLLVAKNAIPSEGNWAGFWGNEAIDQKLYDIGTSGPVVLEPDYSKLKVVGLTQDIAESYVPLNITVSYAGQDGTPKPFLMIINWIKVGKAWKVASEIILPVPPAPAAKGRQHQMPTARATKCNRKTFASATLLASPLNANCPPRPRRLLLWNSTFPMGNLRRK
jgi:hypothetical protein